MLRTPSPHDKAALTDEIAALWAKGDIRVAYDPDPDAKHEAPPDKPARYARPSSASRRAQSRNLVPTRARVTIRPSRARARRAFPPNRPETNEKRKTYAHRFHGSRSRSRLLRDDRVTLVEPSKAPRLGKGGTPESRIAILHSLAHIESWAIDLSWDAVARFGAARRMPKAFFDDFVAVAADEARHFSRLAARLQALGSHYGALSAHDGLWDSAAETSGSLEARLVIEHCVHEARGLDVLPATIGKFRNGGDAESADLLERVILPEETTHCAAGVRWFTFLCARRDASCGDTKADAPQLWEGQGPLDTDADVEKKSLSASAPKPSASAGSESSSARTLALAREVFETKKRRNPEPPLAEDASVPERFHRIVWRYFRGVLKPPFNEGARLEAGFGKEWYEPLCERPEWETCDVEKEAAAFFAAEEAKARAKKEAAEAEKRAAEAEAARKQKHLDDVADTNRRIFLL